MLTSTPAPSRTQLPGLDLARFFAACIVMLYHLGYSTWAMKGRPTAAILTSNSGADFHELTAVASAGWVGVEIFFVISGFVILYSAEHSGARDFAWARAIRLYPAALATTSISLLAIVLVRGWSTGLLNEYLHSVLLWPFGPWLDGVYWTLGVEMVFYAVIFLMLAAGRREHLLVATSAIGLVSCAFHAWLLMLWATDGLAAVTAIVRSSRLITLSLLAHGVFFALGALLYSRMRGTPGRHDRWLLVMFLCFGVAEILIEASIKSARDFVPLAPVIRLLPVAAWLMAVGAIALLAAHNERTTLFLQRARIPARHLGLITYPLYLLHTTLGSALFVLMTSVGLGKWPSLVMAMVLCVLSASLVVTRFEMPLQRVLKRQISRTPRADLSSA